MAETPVKPVCLWSGPRNVSTALMYSFAQLDEVRVIDEPLYGHYLRVTRAPHPGRDEVIAAMDCNGERVMRSLIERQRRQPAPRLFLKHMAHHLADIDLAFLDETDNVLLIRDPRDMLPSLRVQLPNAGLADTGLEQQWSLYRRLERRGVPPTVVDARELLLDPRRVLTRLCERIGLGYSDDMLTWKPGPRPEDGVWAPHWYHAVHASSGFRPYRRKHDFPAELEELLAAARPAYEQLYAHAIRHAGTEKADVHPRPS